TILVGVLHFGLAGDQPGQNVVTKREIGGSRCRPHAKQCHGAHDDPEHDWPEPNLLAGMDECVSRLDLGGRRHSMMALRLAASKRFAAVMGMMLGVLGIMARTMRHRHSRAGRMQSSVRPNCGTDLTFTWLIFCQYRRKAPGNRHLNQYFRGVSSSRGAS